MRLMSLLDKFDKLQRLSSGEIRLLLQAYFLLHLTALSLRLFPFRQWREKLFCSRRRVVDCKEDAARQLRQAQRTAAMVRKAAACTLLPARCLEQSLVLSRLLRQQRIRSRLYFGVRKENGQLQAHAWVECEGVPLAEPADVPAAFRVLAAGAV